jgi:hypothetical protein
MARDPSPLDHRNYDPDSPYVHDHFRDIDSGEDDRYRSRGSRAPGPREPKHPVRNLGPHIRPIHGRAIVYDRNRGHRVTLTQAHSLRDLAKFRVIAVHDLTEFLYLNRKERAVPELRNLVRQDLVRMAVFDGPEGTPKELATLTRVGRRVVGANRLVAPEQATYSGFGKPREANHDADLYRMYQQEAARIQKEGGEPLRVVLDYELKKNIHRDIALYGRLAAPEIAARYALSAVRGKIPVPDLQIEYVTRDKDRALINLELVTEHYRGSSVDQKVRAGFRLYTPHGEADRLRRLCDQYEWTAEILSL